MSMLTLIAFVIGAGRAYAANLYFQPADTATINTYSGITNRIMFLLGSFTTDGTDRDLTGGTIQFTANFEQSGSCGSSGPPGSPANIIISDIATTSPAFSFSQYYSNNTITFSQYHQDVNFNLTLGTNAGYLNSSVLPAATTTYYVYLINLCAAQATINVHSSVAENFYGLISDSGGISELLDDTTTRIYETNPTYGETKATSSDFYLEADSYINSNDYDSDMFMRFKFVRQQDLQAAVADPSLLYHVIDFPSLDSGGADAITDGYNFTSTTTPITQDGLYFWTIEIRRDSTLSNIFDWLGLNSFYDAGLVYSTTTRFIAGAPNSYDQYVSYVQDLGQSIASTTATSTAQVKADCNLFTFDLTGCLSGLFGFQDLSYAFANARDNFFSYAPFGYVKRTLTILTGTASTTLPTVSATLPASSPSFLSNLTITFNPWQYFYVDGSPLKDEIKSTGANPKNAWEIFEPVWKFLIYMGLLFKVLNDLLHVHGREESEKNL